MDEGSHLNQSKRSPLGLESSRSVNRKKMGTPPPPYPPPAAIPQMTHPLDPHAEELPPQESVLQRKPDGTSPDDLPSCIVD